MVGAGVIVGLIAIWLAGRRLEFTWRMAWLSVIFALICVSSLAAGGRVAGWIAGGLFELFHGIASLIGQI